jgi:hypothetical protein
MSDDCAATAASGAGTSALVRAPRRSASHDDRAASTAGFHRRTPAGVRPGPVPDGERRRMRYRCHWEHRGFVTSHASSRSGTTHTCTSPIPTPGRANRRTTPPAAREVNAATAFCPVVQATTPAARAPRRERPGDIHRRPRGEPALGSCHAGGTGTRGVLARRPPHQPPVAAGRPPCRCRLVAVLRRPGRRGGLVSAPTPLGTRPPAAVPAHAAGDGTRHGSARYWLRRCGQR